MVHVAPVGRKGLHTRHVACSPGQKKDILLARETPPSLSPACLHLHGPKAISQLLGCLEEVLSLQLRAELHWGFRATGSNQQPVPSGCGFSIRLNTEMEGRVGRGLEEQGLQVGLKKKGHGMGHGPGEAAQKLTHGRPGEKQATVDTGEAEKQLPGPTRVGPSLAN